MVQTASTVNVFTKNFRKLLSLTSKLFIHAGMTTKFDTSPDR